MAILAWQPVLHPSGSVAGLLRGSYSPTKAEDGRLPWAQSQEARETYVHQLVFGGTPGGPG